MEPPLKFVDGELVFSAINLDKDVIGQFLLDQIKESSQCQQAEKMLNLFVEHKIDNEDILLTALLIIFFKFEGSARTLEMYSKKYPESAIFYRFVQEMDRLIVNREDITAFMEKHDLSVAKLKNDRDIKKFLGRMYKNIKTVYDADGNPMHAYYSLTPNFLEMSNWDTLVYLLKVRFKQFKSPMSIEAWYELSVLLVRSSPTIKTRLRNTLRRIGVEEERDWVDRFDNQADFDEAIQPLQRNTMIYEHKYQPLQPGANRNFRYYQGRTSHKLIIKFVDNENDFNFMLDKLKDATVIGLDGEWLPIFSYQPTRVSILQISTLKECFILDLLNFESKSAQFRLYWRRFLSDILEEPNITKLGFGFHHDLENIRASTGMHCRLSQNSMDLSKYTSILIEYFRDQFKNMPHLFVHANQGKLTHIQRIMKNIISRCRNENHPQQGLSLLTYILFGKELDKSEQMSNWNRRPLRQAQVLYAAMDAFCLVDIYELLKRINFDILNAEFESVEEMLYVLKQTYSDQNIELATLQVSDDSSNNGGPKNKKKNKRKRVPNGGQHSSNGEENGNGHEYVNPFEDI